MRGLTTAAVLATAIAGVAPGQMGDAGKKAPESKPAKEVSERPRSGVATGEYAPTEAEVATSIQAAIGLLVRGQENYDGVGDTARPPRRFKTDEDKKAWEEKTKARAEEFAKTAGKVKEWPYQGVNRQSDGQIPIAYRVGGTAFTGLALMAIPGCKADQERQEAVERGLVFCLDQLENHPLIQQGFVGNYDTRGWGHTYGLLFCLHVLKSGLAPKLHARCEAMVRKLIKTLEADEIVETGGWNYSRPRGGEQPNPPCTFMTAPTLQALFEAEARGFKVKRDVITRALKTLEDARTAKGSFQYNTSPGKKAATGGNDVFGSCARSAACEATLQLAGRGDATRLRAAVQAFFDGWDELEARRAKSGTHEGPFAIAPYYFHYGHVYVAQAIEFLPEAERPLARSKLREVYWRTRAEDGTWNDRVFPRSASFGTATAVLGLLMPTLPKPAALK
jgi:hypothetical protein